MRPGKKLWFTKQTPIVLAVLIMLMFPLMVTRAQAHKVNVFAWVEGETVFVECYFPGGKKAQNSLVEVFDKAGAKLLEGRTNEIGEFAFKPSAKTDLRIVLTSDMGHKNDFVVPASAFGEAFSSPSGSSSKLEVGKTDSTPATTDPRQLEKMIDKALDRKLAPVIKLLRDSRREVPTVTEIVGGIGYIFGLFGLFVYFKSRKKGQ